MISAAHTRTQRPPNRIAKKSGKVIDPHTDRDLVAGKCIKNIAVDGGRVKVDVVLGYPAKSWAPVFAAQLKERVESVEGVDEAVQECEAQMASCSKDDHKVMMEFQDCLVDAAGGDTCDLMGTDTTTGTTTTGTGGMGDFMAMLACFGALNDLSEECAVAGFGTTTTYSDTGF